MLRPLRLALVVGAAFSVLVGGPLQGRLRDGAGQERHAPLSPAEALATFELEPGYRIELVASEPLVRDPVAIAFDERGRMYVAENRGYPDPPDAQEGAPAEGAIALLEDVDGDGRFETRTDFATGLAYPNGVLPWDGGVFVSSAPDLLYLKDTTGDGVADVRRVVLTGWEKSRTAQIRFSHPTLGLDNWVYLTSGLAGGKVTAPDYPERPAVAFTPSDTRFDPRTLQVEVAGGQGQFGLTFDDFGRRFICSNRHPVRHVVLEPRYLERNPHLAASTTVADVSTTGSEAVVWPISADGTTASFTPSLMSAPHAGTFTAASGVHIHRGDALPEGHAGSIFVCESAQNLVQRQILARDGVTFSSRPARQGIEFLASRDRWFRPVFAANGPDGALYVVDMYRQNIDHPEYLPESSRAAFDFAAGRDLGRIYRVVDRTWERKRERVDLGILSAGELCQALEHPNAWWRETAQRLLVTRGRRDAVPFLRRLAAAGVSAPGRVHALWTLRGLDALDDEAIAGALRDAAAGVRENAVQLSEERLPESAAIRSGVLALATDPDPRVRFRVALALGETPGRRAVEALAELARRDGANRWIRTGILASTGSRTDEFLRAFRAPPPAPPDVTAAVMQDLAHLVAAAGPVERTLGLIEEIVAPSAELTWQLAALSGAARGLRARAEAPPDVSPLLALADGNSPRLRRAGEDLRTLLRRAAGLALDGVSPAARRLEAVELLGEGDYSSSGKALTALLAPEQPHEIQAAAARALGRLPGAAAAAALVEPALWKRFTPRMREAVLTVLLGRPSHTDVLLDAVERGHVAATELGSLRRGRLLNSRDGTVRQRAARLFASVESGDRMRVYQEYRRRIETLAGNAQKGRDAFVGHCATCHRVRGTGGDLAPDLSGIRNQPAEAILLHMLVPDYEITPGYATYAIETRDGATILGLLQSETPQSVTVRDAASRPHTLLRREVVAMTAASASLMPGDLERVMSEQELADVIAYLKSELP